jgi:hypothetical protein
VNPAELIQPSAYPLAAIRRLAAIRLRVVIRVQLEPVEIGTQALAFALAGLIFTLMMFVFTRESLFPRH